MGSRAKCPMVRIYGDLFNDGFIIPNMYGNSLQLSNQKYTGKIPKSFCAFHNVNKMFQLNEIKKEIFFGYGKHW